MTHPLEELAARVGKAEGPDRDLDAASYDLTPHALDYLRIGIRLTDTSRLDRYHDGWVTVYAAKGETDPYPEDLPRYTASLDAAMTLVPEGWRVAEMKDGIPHEDGPYCQIRLWCPNNSFLGFKYRGTAATPALALVAASLRARAAVEEG